MSSEQVGKIWWDSRIETKNFKKDAQGLDGEVDSLGSRMGSKFASIAKFAGKAGALALVAGFGLAIKNTAQLEQSMGGLEVVFGDSAKKMKELAVNSYAVMGTSANQYAETANKMGSLYQGAGYTIAESSKMSAEAMQRSTDVATAMGISSESALESVAGMAKGNFTMMDNLGVAMNDTALQAYATAKGMKKVVTTMTPMEKVGLATQLFMERTAKYAGNYAKENMTLSGSFQTLKGAFTNFLGGVEGGGEQLAKALKGMIDVLIQKLPEIVGALGSAFWGFVKQIFGEDNETLKKAEGIFKTIATAVQVVVDVFKGNDAGALMSDEDYQRWQGFVDVVTKVKDAFDWFITTLKNVWTFIQVNILPMLTTIASVVWTAVKPAIDAIIGAFKQFWTTIQPLLPVLKVIGLILIAVVVGALIVAGAVILGIIIVVAKLIEWFAKLVTWTMSLGTKIWEMQKNAWDAMVRFNQAIGDGIKGAINWFKSLPDKIREAIGRAGTMLKDTGRNIIQGLIDGVTGMAGAMTGAIRRLIDKIPDAVKKLLGIHSPSRVFMGFGENIVAGLAIGVKETIPEAMSAMNSLVEGVNGFGISAPAMGAMNTGAGNNAPTTTTTGVNNIGVINVSNELDGHYWLDKLTNDQTAELRGLTPQRTM